MIVISILDRSLRPKYVFKMSGPGHTGNQLSQQIDQLRPFTLGRPDNTPPERKPTNGRPGWEGAWRWVQQFLEPDQASKVGKSLGL